MDRRQIHDVEAELGDAGEGPLGVAERAVPFGIGGRGAGEELVPRGKAGLAAVDSNPVLPSGAGESIGLAVRGHEALELGREPGGDARSPIGRRVAQQRGEVRQPRVIVAAGVRLGLAYPVGSLQQLGAHIQPGVDLLGQLASPGGEPIDPALEREAPLARPVERQRGIPAVILEGVRHGDGQRPSLARRAEEHPGREDIVSVGEDVGADP
jgi:hypothetical protein